MSRAALEVQRQVEAMRAEAAKKKPRNQERNVENAERDEKELTEETGHDMTGPATDLSEAGEEYTGKPAGASTETGKERTRTVAKKKKDKAAKAPKAAKAAAAPKGERKSRVKVVSGDLVSVEAKGTTYLQLNFTEGHIVLTPTGNREANRDLAVKALRSALK